MMKNTFRPVRVAVISSSLKLGGAEKQTVYQTRALREAGADVRVFHLGEGAYYEQVLRQIGIPLIQIYKRNGPMLILARLSKALRRFGPEIVFSPQFGDLLQAGLAGRLCHALVLGGVRSDGFYELNSNGRRSPWMLRLAHGLVANSHCGWHNLVSRGAKPSKIKILPNVLDLREFDARRQLSPALSPQPERVIAAAVGSLQPCKRFDRFLKALALARREAPALLGVIAGSDWGCRVDLEYEANQLGLAPNHVVFVGECDNVPALLTQAGFLVLCSEYEGFPNVVLEAMAARLPVVTTPVGDVERIVSEDQTGYVVDGADIEAMAARMIQLARSRELRARLGTEGRNRVSTEYNYEYLPVRLLAIFSEFAALYRRSHLMEVLRGWSAAREMSPLPEYGVQTRAAMQCFRNQKEQTDVRLEYLPRANITQAR